MEYLPQIMFVIILVISVYFFARKVRQIRRNILLGRDADFSDNKDLRWKNLLLLAFGQKKMFRNPLVAVLHFIVYAGFLIINIEVLEILIDGIAGTHRILAGVSSGLYFFLINAFEFLALGVLIACAIFLIRRNVIKLKRFISRDLDGWPRSDANYILITEIVLMALFLIMNAADTLLAQRGVEEYAATPGNFILSKSLHPLLEDFSNQTLMVTERAAWWLHI